MLQRMLEQKRALHLYCGEHGGFSSPTAQQWDLSLEKRFSKLEDTKPVVLACLLDPRYKSHAFSVATTMNKAKEWLKEEVDASTQQTSREEHAVTDRASMEVQATTEEARVEEQAAACGTHEDDGNTHKRQRREQTSICSRVDEMFTSLLAPHTDDQLASGCIEDELYLYLKEPVIDRRQGDPLQWWKQNEGRFKQLAKHARKFLCAPPSSVPSEQIFSEVSTIYERKRSRLTGEHSEQLCFLHHNLVSRSPLGMDTSMIGQMVI
uniref:HAT C-terminal dimerisation domain-containing protein n=1 Tax=Amphiprion percula TaxID=161767 RepID=A0A3P8TXB9_AMPPE